MKKVIALPLSIVLIRQGFAKEPWQLLADKQDGKFLSTKEAGGFVGSVFTLYTTSSGNNSRKKAYFNWFEYKGNDERYRR